MLVTFLNATLNSIPDFGLVALAVLEGSSQNKQKLLMKVSYTHFSPGAVIRERYQKGVDYLEQEFDLGFDDTLYLLKELRNHRSSLWVDTPNSRVEFSIASDGILCVDIECWGNGLWAASDITLEAGIEILRIAFDGGEFGELIPTTDQEWGAYAWSYGHDS